MCCVQIMCVGLVGNQSRGYAVIEYTMKWSRNAGAMTWRKCPGQESLSYIWWFSDALVEAKYRGRNLNQPVFIMFDSGSVSMPSGVRSLHNKRVEQYQLGKLAEHYDDPDVRLVLAEEAMRISCSERSMA